MLKKGTHGEKISNRWKEWKIQTYLSKPLISGFGGLVVSMVASCTQDRGFAPSRSRRIFSCKKNHQPFAPCRRYSACQKTL
jgi:hypothetical protein